MAQNALRSNPPSEYELQGITAETLETSEREKFLVWHSEPFEPKKKTLILFPGNFGHLGAMESGIDNGYVDLFKKAQAEGYQIMGVNYVGYAGIPGKPSEAAFFRGAERTIDWLIEHGLQPSDMILRECLWAPLLQRTQQVTLQNRAVLPVTHISTSRF